MNCSATCLLCNISFLNSRQVGLAGPCLLCENCLSAELKINKKYDWQLPDVGSWALSSTS